MAVRRYDARTAGTVSIRVALAAEYRRMARRVAESTAHDSPWPDPGYDRVADSLDAGEPVVVPGWKLRKFLEPSPDESPRSFRVEPDGSVTAMKAVHHADTVYWEPIDGPQRWVPRTTLEAA